MSKNTPNWTEGLFPEAATKDAWEAAGNKFHEQISFSVAANEEDRKLMQRLSEKYGEHVVAVWVVAPFGPDEPLGVMVQFGDSTPAKRAMLACLSDFVRSTKESTAVTAFPQQPKPTVWNADLYPHAATAPQWEAQGNTWRPQLHFTGMRTADEWELQKGLAEKYGEHVVAQYLMPLFGDVGYSLELQFATSKTARAAMASCRRDYVREAMKIDARTVPGKPKKRPTHRS